MRNTNMFPANASRKRHPRRGQSVIEGLLVLIALTAVILGIFDFGQMVFVHQMLTERTRAAARYGGLHPTETTAVRNLVLHGSTTAPEGQQTGFWGLTPEMVSVQRVHQDSSEDSVVVTVSNYQFRFLSLWITGSVRGRTLVASSPVEL